MSGRSEPRSRSWVAALVLLGSAIAAVLVAPHPSAAPSGPPPGRGEPVRNTLLACPALKADAQGGRTTYGVGSADLSDVSSGGEIRLDPDGEAPGRGRTVAGRAPAEQGLTVTAAGGLAQGLFAWRVDDGKALATLRCDAPRGSWWFAGAGASLDHESTLVLTNLDAGPAVVDVDVFGPQGPVDVSASGGRGITVGPGEHVALSMVELAPQSDELAVHVVASQGRVVAAMRDRYAGSATSTPGDEWLSGAAAPARIVRLVGAPAGGHRTLVVANPGDSVAPLTVEVTGPNGRSLATGLGDLSVGPGSVTTVDLSKVLRGEAYGVIVRSERPVVAGLRVLTGAGDDVVAGPALPLTAPAAVPVVGASTLQLVGGAAPSRVRVQMFGGSGGQLAEQSVELDANALVQVPVQPEAAYAVVTPTQGMPYGAVLSVVRKRASAQPLADLPVLARVPGVRPAG
ncbi:MAG: DUF5719 family protein [Nocardioidaceae bacterium]